MRNSGFCCSCPQRLASECHAFCTDLNLRPDSTRAVIATPETAKRIVAMIGDPDFNLRQDILEALVDLAQYSEYLLSYDYPFS